MSLRLKQRMRAQGWICRGFFAGPPRAADVGRIMIEAANYPSTECDVCDGRLWDVFLVCAKPQPPSSRVVLRWANLFTVATFCIRCGYALATTEGRARLNCDTDYFNMSDYLAAEEARQGERFDALRWAAISDEIRAHEAALARLRRLLPAPAEPKCIREGAYR